MNRANDPACVITASRTRDGAAVYLRADRGWSPDLSRARVVTDEAARDALLAWASTREAEVCDPYALRVTLERDLPRPCSSRERIRAAGPTRVLARLGYA